MYLQFNDAARIAMRLAEHEARRWGDERVDTRHLLLGLYLLPDCVADRVLTRGTVLEGCVRVVVKRLGPAEPGPVNAGRLRMTPELRKAIDLALAAAERLGHPRVGTGHLLLGLLEEDGVACRALCKAGIGRVGKNLSAVARHVCEVMDGAKERRRDDGERVVLPNALPKYSPGADCPTCPPGEALEVDRPAPVTPPAKRGTEDEVIASLSVALMVAAALNLLLPGGDLSLFIDVALFLLGAAGARAVSA